MLLLFRACARLCPLNLFSFLLAKRNGRPFAKIPHKLYHLCGNRARNSHCKICLFTKILPLSGQTRIPPRRTGGRARKADTAPGSRGRQTTARDSRPRAPNRYGAWQPRAANNCKGKAAAGGMKQGHAPREVRSTLPPAHNPRRFRRGIGRSPLPPKNIPAPRCFTPSYAQIHNILWITQKFFTRYCLSPLDNEVWRCYNKGLHEKRDRKHFYKAGKGEDYVPSHQERRADRGI